MTNVIFGFKGTEISVAMEKQKAKELFESITGVTIIDNDDSEQNMKQNIKFIDEKDFKHPTIEELVEFLRKNKNSGITYKLIKDAFYPNYTGRWGKLLQIIHYKIQKAFSIVEESENGKFRKIKEGKYVRYKFYRVNTTLEGDLEFGVQYKIRGICLKMRKEKRRKIYN